MPPFDFSDAFAADADYAACRLRYFARFADVDTLCFTCRHCLPSPTLIWRRQNDTPWYAGKRFAYAAC